MRMPDPLCPRRRPACVGLVPTLLLTAAMVALPGPARPDELEADEVRALREQGSILPLEAILERARAVRPGRVIEVELEREDGALVYELELLDSDGNVWEVYVDAETGQVLHEERED